jgi:hypothetical protein
MKTLRIQLFASHPLYKLISLAVLLKKFTDNNVEWFNREINFYCVQKSDFDKPTPCVGLSFNQWRTL